MNLRIILLVTILAFSALAMPSANAAVTLYCNSGAFANNVDYRFAFPIWNSQYGIRTVKPDFNGEIYFTHGRQQDINVAPLSHRTDSLLFNQNKNCGTDWSQSYICNPDAGGGVSFQCVFTNGIPDPAGGVVNFAKLTSSAGGGTNIGQQHQRFNPATGNVYTEIPNYELSASYYSAANPAATPTDGDSYILNGKVFTITTAAGQPSGSSGDTTIRVWNDTALQWTATYTGGSRPVTVTAQSGVANPYAFIVAEGPTNTYQASEMKRLDLVAQTFSAALSGAPTGAQPFSFSPMKVGYSGESGNVFALHSGSNGLKVVVEKINIAAWTTTSETELLLGGVQFGSAASLTDWDIDGINNFMVCGYHNGSNTWKMYKGDSGAATITEIYSEAMPSGWVSVNWAACKFDYNGGIQFLAIGGCTGPGALGASSCMIQKRFLVGDSFVNPTYPKTIDTTIYVGLDETTTTTGPNSNNPVVAAVDYFADSWNIDFTAAGALFAMAILGFLAFRLKGYHTLIIATVMFVGIELCIRLTLLPDWLRFVEIFLIIAVAAHQLFERRAASEESGD